MSNRLISVPSRSIVIECIKAGLVDSLPIPVFVEISIGDFICFEADQFPEEDGEPDYVYVLVRSMIPQWSALRCQADTELDHVWFSVIDSLESIVLG